MWDTVRLNICCKYRNLPKVQKLLSFLSKPWYIDSWRPARVCFKMLFFLHRLRLSHRHGCQQVGKRETTKRTALHHSVMSWQRLLDRQQNTWRTCKSSPTQAGFAGVLQAIRLPAVSFHSKLLSPFLQTSSYCNSAEKSTRLCWFATRHFSLSFTRLQICEEMFSNTTQWRL